MASAGDDDSDKSAKQQGPPPAEPPSAESNPSGKRSESGKGRVERSNNDSDRSETRRPTWKDRAERSTDGPDRSSGRRSPPTKKPTEGPEQAEGRELDDDDESGLGSGRSRTASSQSAGEDNSDPSTGSGSESDGPNEKSGAEDPEPWKRFGEESANVQSGPESDGSISDQSSFFPFAERELGEASYGLDVLVVAALEKEIRPAIDIFDATLRVDPDDPAPTYEATIRTPLEPACKVHLLCLHDMGGRVDVLIAKALDRWQPRNVLLIGIAAMNPAVEDLRLGDLLIASSIVDASHVKVEGTDPEVGRGDGGGVSPRRTYRTETVPCDRQLLRPMQDYAMVQSSDYRAAVGSIVSMDWLVKDAPTRDSLLSEHHRAIGLEMEGHGLINAVAETLVGRRPAIGLVKAAVDFADVQKNDSYQATGAAHAARFVREVLERTSIPMAGRGSLPPARHRSANSVDVIPIDRTEIDRCTSVIVVDEATERRMNAIRDSPLMAAVGLPGSGRYTLAADLLGRRHSAVYQLRHLKRVSDLGSLSWEPECGYLVRLADHLRPSRDDVVQIQEALKQARSSLVLLAPPIVLAGRDISDVVAEVSCSGHGGGLALLRNHVRNLASSDETAERALGLIDDQCSAIDLDSLSARRLADAAKEAVGWSERDDSDLGYAPELFGNVGRSRFDEVASTIDDRITLLSHAAFFGVPLPTIARASDRLRAVLLPEESAKAPDPFAESESARNARLGIRAWTRSVGLFQEEVEQKVAGVGSHRESVAVLRHAWTEYPQIQDQLVSWLQGLAEEGPHHQRDAAANTLGVLATESAPELLADPISGWAGSEVQRLRWNAGLALSELLASESTSAVVAGLLEDWSDEGAAEWLRCTACHASVWAAIKGYETDPELLLRATKPPDEEWFRGRRKAGAGDWGAVWELRFALWQSILIAPDLPSGAAGVMTTVGLALDRADRKEESFLASLMALAMRLGEAGDTERGNYGSLYLLRAKSKSLRDVAAAMTVRLIDVKASSRHIGRVVQAWAFASLDHPSLAEEALLMLEVVWALSPPATRELLMYELQDAAEIAEAEEAAFLRLGSDSGGR